MIISIMKNPNTFLDLVAVLSLRRANVVAVNDNNFVAYTGNIRMSFKLTDMSLGNGTYLTKKINQHEIDLDLISETCAYKAPTVSEMIFNIEPVQCNPMINSSIAEFTGKTLPTKVAYALNSRKLGKTADVFICNDSLFINCENINIKIEFAKEEFTSKLLTGIPESVMTRLDQESTKMGLPTSTYILHLLQTEDPPAPSTPVVPTISKVNKMIQGIPDEHMLVLTEQAASAEISVNRLILGLIEEQVRVPKLPRVTSEPKSYEPKHNKLLTAVPVSLMNTLKTNAASCGLSVNKYILEVLKNA
jgi:predicted HicB family RNase H-like nuclease